MQERTHVRVAAIGDLHFGKASQGQFLPVLAQIGSEADLLLICGDLTDYGSPEEAQGLVRELAAVKVPIVTVLGNHDYEADRQDEVRAVLSDAGIAVLDGEAVEVLGIGIAGIKGFAGGFGARALGPWGESIIKSFVHEAVQESLKLETALARLRTPRKLVLLHYSPVRSTVEGEPLEIFPYLGSSRLEEPLMHHSVDAIFHGHAHNGQLEGATVAGAPVYNVSLPLLRRLSPERPFKLLELAVNDTQRT
jgi:Icc-related predicted phosphoesterase